MTEVLPITVAPWTEQQVESINGYQGCGMFHPFTCGQRSDHPDNSILIAASAYLYCPHEGCDYQQEWVYEFMSEGSWEPWVLEFEEVARKWNLPDDFV